MIVPVLLSGGVGLRLWPLSTPDSPKQFLRIFGRESLLQSAARRVMGMEEVSAPLVVTGRSMLKPVAEHLGEIGCVPAGVLSEPVGRNTAPAAMAAALWADSDDLLLGLPTDHLVGDEAGFRSAVRVAIAPAREGHPVIFGIRPSRPHPGLGYLEVSPGVPAGVLEVRRFVEKPDTKTARRMVDSGAFLWNGGMFLTRAEVMRELIDRLLPEVAQAVRKAYAASVSDPDGTVELGAEFESSPSVSVAKGLWERTEQIRAVAMEAGWSDIGSWEALGEVLEADAHHNVINGKGVVESAEGVHIHSSDTPTAVIGVDDVVVVVANRRVLVASRKMWEQTGESVTTLEELA